MAYSPKTNKMQTNIQISIAVSPSAFGELVVTLLKMLTSTRNKVIRRVILPNKENGLTLLFKSDANLPGTMSGGMRKEIQETTTKSPEGR